MRSHPRALFAVAALFAFLLVPSSAFAAKGVVGAFGEKGEGAGQFDWAGGVALNQASGDVYVADAEFQFSPTGGHRIAQFDADGNFIRTWGWGVDTGAEAFEICTSDCQAGIQGSGEGQLSIKAFTDDGNFFIAPQLAVDQSDGSLYVADAGNDRIQKFSASGAFLDQFGTEGTADGQFNNPQGVAVDPTSGDVYVADTDNNRIQRFDSAGNHLTTIGTTSGGFGEAEFFTPRRIAVDSTGRLYVLDNGNNRIQRFTSAGVFDQLFASGQLASPVELAIDPANDNVLIFDSGAIAEFDASGSLLASHAGGSGLPGGLGVRSSGGRIYVSDAPSGRVLILDEVNQPTVSIEPVTDVSGTEATFNGIVNPQGPPNAKYRFEYSTDGSTWTGVPEEEVSLGEGSADVPVTQTATGLQPNTEYRVRLVANKAFGAGSATSAELTFETESVAPIVETLEPGVVTSSSAWIGAMVNPQNSPTTYYIEYSTDPGFANSTSIPASKDASAGSANSPQFVNAQVKGLGAEKTYHYRVVATNEAGTTIGERRSFTTLPASPPVQGLPDGRVWEKVSPAEKAGGHIAGADISRGGNQARLSQAAADGDAVVFASEGKFGGEGGPPYSQYLARRGPEGWVTEGISPRTRPGSGLDTENFFNWFAEDLSWGVAVTGAGLNPGDPNEGYNLYIRDNEARTYRFVTSFERQQSNFRSISADGTTVVFFRGTTGADPRLFIQKVGDESASPITVPNGADVAVDIGNGRPEAYSYGFNPISDDNSKVYFSTIFPSPNPSIVSATYLREGGTSTLVSASERSGDDPTEPRRAQFLGASKDGSVAFFASAQPLTDSSNADPSSGGCGEFPLQYPDYPVGVAIGCAHLYRWDATAPVGERLTDLTTADPLGAMVFGMTAISDDGSSVYFVAAGDLTGSGDREPQLYLWREGEGIRLVANAGDLGLWTLSRGGGDGPRLRQARVTPDGRFLAFASRAQLTGYDTNGKNQVYLYDSLTEKLTCASCSTFAIRSKADSWLLSRSEDTVGNLTGLVSTRLPANLTPDGKRLVFDSRDALLPEDTNGTVDVYQWQEGELSLLSSGTSASASRLIDASVDLDDVFFVTEQKLVRSDKDNLTDLYDARVGGVPEPDVTPPCVADECQGTPAPPPTFQTPSSSNFQGAGNAAAKKPRCAKGKVRRKGRCVKRKARKAKRKAKSGGRATR